MGIFFSIHTPKFSFNLTSMRNNMFMENLANDQLTLEPVAFLTLFSWSLTSAAIQDQILFQACTVDLGFSEIDCSIHSNLTESAVQPIAANMLMVRNISDSVMSVAFTSFIGPWSDKHGRRPVLIAVSISSFLIYLTLTILNFVGQHLSGWFYVLPFSFMMFVGGRVTFFATLSAFVTDMSTEETRAKKLVVLESIQNAGTVSGLMASNYILGMGGGRLIMGVAATANLLVVLWNVFVLKERRLMGRSLILDRGLFLLRHLRDMIKVIMRPRNRRRLLWTLIAVLGLIITVMRGNETLLFMFARKRLQWDLPDFTFYNETSTIWLIICNLVIMYGLRRTLKVADETLVLLGFMSALMSNVTVAFASETWHMYLAIAFAGVSGVTKPVCRSIMATISKKSNEKEIGKLFSVSASLEAVLPLIGVPLYAAVYQSTIQSYPGTFCIVSGALMGLCALGILLATKCRARKEEYEELNGNENVIIVR